MDSRDEPRLGTRPNERDHNPPELATRQRIRSLLEEQPFAVLCTQGGGQPYGSVIAFAVVTETVFSWPGMGKLIIDSINLLDRPIIVAYLMLTVLMFVIINLIVDFTYSLIDPRVRLGDME